MEKFDVVIIGAGPAGLSAAKILAEGGKKVVIFEKKTKVGPKICAGGLTSKVFDLGIPLSLADKKFYSVKFHCFGKTTEIKRDKILIATVDREKLGQWMANQIERDVEIILDSEVVKIEDDSLVLKSGQKIGFDYLIGADGSSSGVRKYLGLSTNKVAIGVQYSLPQVFNDLELFLDQKLFGSGYVWIFPHQKYTLIGCAYNPSRLKTEILKNFHQVLENENIALGQAKLEAHLINFDYQGFMFGNKFLAGDAGGFTLDISGEGIYSAIVSGREVARKILDPNYNCPKIKKILALKVIQEKWGKYLMFKIFRSKFLTRLIFKRSI